MGLKLQVGKWLTYMLYLYPKEVDEIMKVLDLQFKKEGVGTAGKAILRRPQFTDRQRKRR